MMELMVALLVAVYWFIFHWIEWMLTILDHSHLLLLSMKNVEDNSSGQSDLIQWMLAYDTYDGILCCVLYVHINYINSYTSCTYSKNIYICTAKTTTLSYYTPFYTRCSNLRVFLQENKTTRQNVETRGNRKCVSRNIFEMPWL